MSAYFSIIIELTKTKTIIRDFYNALIENGLKFESGFLDEKEPIEDILEWNQNKLLVMESISVMIINKYFLNLMIFAKQDFLL